jgi:spore coat protein U-like protein
MSVGRGAALAVVVMAMASVAGRVEAACTLSTTSVAFGTYNVYSATPLASTGTISLDCQWSDRNVRIDLSRGNSGTYATRTLVGPGTDVLTYNLFRNAAYTQIWGNGTSGTSYYSNSAPGSNVINLTVYGRITAGQDVRAGAYTDTVVATVTF